MGWASDRLSSFHGHLWLWPPLSLHEPTISNVRQRRNSTLGHQGETEALREEVVHPAGLADLVSDSFCLLCIILSPPLCLSLSQPFFMLLGLILNLFPFLCLSVSLSLSVCVSVSIFLCLFSFCKLPSPPAQNTPPKEKPELPRVTPTYTQTARLTSYHFSPPPPLCCTYFAAFRTHGALSATGPLH